MSEIIGILFITNGVILFVGGFLIVIFSKNIIKMIIGFILAGTGVNILLISMGYVYNKNIPIFNKIQFLNNASSISVDPVPQALVLTAIVISVATTALFLFYALRFYKEKGTLNRDYMEDTDD